LEVFLELGFLLVVAVSAVLGFALRSFVRPTLARACALIGLASLVLGLGILGLTATGRSPFDTLTSGLVAAVALVAAGLILPFAFVVGWGRF
jgi:hypothetical protein